jgi:hypothetical protein
MRSLALTALIAIFAFAPRDLSHDPYTIGAMSVLIIIDLAFIAFGV